MPVTGHILLWEYNTSGRYEARQKEDILIATTSTMEVKVHSKD